MCADEPLVVSVLDGSIIRLFLEDEDDFAMLAENLFTDLDTEDDGKLSKCEIRNALVNMGVEMGVPPLSGLHSQILIIQLNSLNSFTFVREYFAIAAVAAISIWPRE